MPQSVQDASTRLPFTQVLNTIPSPLTVALIGLHRHIARIRRLLEIVSWRSGWEESWLALASWWMMCLCVNFALRYVFDVLYRYSEVLTSDYFADIPCLLSLLLGFCTCSGIAQLVMCLQIPKTRFIRSCPTSVLSNFCYQHDQNSLLQAIS